MNDGPLSLPTLSGSRVGLRRWTQADRGVVQEASQDPLIPLLTTVPSTSGAPEAAAFIDRQHDRVESGAGYVFAIADHDDRAVGHIGLFPIAGAGTRASVGYWITPSRRRQGFAVDSLIALTQWAVGLPQLDRIELYVEPWNEGSWRTAERAGYEREGLMRSWERVADEPRDMYMYARLTDARPANSAR